jgi:integrase
MVRDRRTLESPIQGLSALKKSDKDTRPKRRPLTDAEMMALVNTTRASSDSFRGLTGKDRAMLYILAANTGLRASELASPTPASFDFKDEPATVRVLGAYTKNKEEAFLPLRTDVASGINGPGSESGLLAVCCGLARGF